MNTTTKENTRLITRLKTHSQITIPAKLRKLLNLETGALLEASTDGKRLIFTPKQEVTTDTDIEQAFKEALKDIRENKGFGPFSSVEEFENGLKKEKVKKS